MKTQLTKQQLCGQCHVTIGVQRWVETGLMPYATDTDTADPSPIEHRIHHIAVAATSHRDGCDGDTCAEDAQLNDEVRAHPGQGHRLMTVWERNGYPKIWIITDDFGGPGAVTTVLFPEDY